MFGAKICYINVMNYNIIYFKFRGWLTNMKLRVIIISFFIFTLFNFYVNTFADNDILKLEVIDVNVANLGYKSAEISWMTTEASSSTLVYWSSKDNMSKSIDTIEGTEHEVFLDNLMPNTKYYYQIYSRKDPLYRYVESEIYSFTTSDLHKITDVKVENTGYKSTEISWMTTEASSSTLVYWSSKDNMSKSIDTIEGTEHKVFLDNLMPNTKYYYQIYSRKDPLYRYVESEIYSFTTEDYDVYNNLFLEDSFEIKDIKVDNIGYKNVDISWATTDIADSIIYCGRTLDELTFHNIKEIANSKENKVTIDNLQPGVKYYCRILTRKPDSSLEVESEIFSFTTEELYKITDIKVDNIGYKSADISWVTTDIADSIIYCGRTLDELTFHNIKEIANSKENKVTIDNLQPGVTYYCRISTRKPDLYMEVESDIFSFTTLNQNGYKISGYITPDFINNQITTSPLKAGFKVELYGTSLATESNEDGYFEIKNIPEHSQYTIKISKQDYLLREIHNINLTSDLQISKLDAPIKMWAGDVSTEGLQDNVINIKDIIEIAKVFNSSNGDDRYISGYDFNKDNAINMLDIIIVAKHFNCTTTDY
jgi:hypothetical protein